MQRLSGRLAVIAGGFSENDQACAQPLVADRLEPTPRHHDSGLCPGDPLVTCRAIAADGGLERG
ncbi:MAG: hypothetical protein KIS86_08065 [Devosia sp.]|nr:hypothetical protein [Devosia sp.]